MSSNQSDKDKFKHVNPDHMIFGTEGQAANIDPKIQQEMKEEAERIKKEQERIKELEKNSSLPHLPKDPAYKVVPDDILTINDYNKRLAISTKVMINVSLGDYCIVRAINENGEDTNVKILFKRVNYEEYGKYQEIQEQLDDYNNRILLLTNQADKTEATYDRIREYRKASKPIIDQKANVGLPTFFKPDNNLKAIMANKKGYDYNDILLSCEIGYFRYNQSPFLRSISSSSNTS